MINLNEYKDKKLHFIAIGGHSMCGLAEFLHSMGFSEISGSDRSDSPALDRLRGMGICAKVGHDVKNVEGAQLVCYSAAIPKDNCERAYAEQNNIPCIDRGCMLGLISDLFPKCIGISGTHGKTTVTSMISEIFFRANVDPSIHIGGVLPTIGSNVRMGKSEFFITEACEYVDSFLHLHPYCAIILNIDSDHLDYFKTVENICRSFKKFTENVIDGGYVIGCYDDIRTRAVLENCDKKTVSYGFDKNADYHAENMKYAESGCPEYDFYDKNGFLAHVELSVIGKVNVLNSMAAIITALINGISLEQAITGIKMFTGAGRRFEKRCVFNGASIYNDYGHHPQEVAALIDAARHIKKNRLWVVYQPALFSRTKAQFNRLVDCFVGADKVVLVDVYGDREPFDPTVNSKMIVDKIHEVHPNNDAVYIAQMRDAAEHLKKELLPGDVVLVMGSGTIDIFDKFICENN